MKIIKPLISLVLALAMGLAFVNGFMKNIENDALARRITEDEANTRIMKIKAFVDSLDGFNCGRPLKEI